ncbi:MAG: toxin-antitoxin system protein [Acidobacteria bacterium]|nr:toxin-antitoxin system protein [Acidobacteriota bacterium]
MSQVRVSESTHDVLRSLSRKEGKPMQDILDEAVEEYRRKAFLEGLSLDFEVLRANVEIGKEDEEEAALWDASLMDGLEDE